MILVLALTLALASADTASIGAVASELKSSLGIGNGELAPLAVAARSWAAATMASSLAWSSSAPLGTRVLLGVLLLCRNTNVRRNLRS